MKRKCQRVVGGHTTHLSHLTEAIAVAVAAAPLRS